MALLLIGQPAQLRTTGTVQRVVDGDTLVLRGVGRVRLIGVDTPEVQDSREEVQQIARESGAYLRRLADGQTVTVEYDQRTRDRYGRLLAYLYLPDGRCINAEIIRHGYGVAYTRYPFRYLKRYRALEREARAAGRGLWAQGGAAR